MKKKNDYTVPVHINKDIWFYPTPKGFDFIVWTEFNNGQRICKTFRLTHKKIAKFLS